ncbi:hypothetical protein [Chitinimonas sp.]|uniref:hypothetical protein n=1 Tax=Chitinimonas sp. TaxID=1934313 RepID=UPI002F94C1C2
MFTPLGLARDQRRVAPATLRWQALRPERGPGSLAGVWSLEGWASREATGLGVIRQADRWLACLHGPVRAMRPVLMLVGEGGRWLLSPSPDGHYQIPLAAGRSQPACYLGLPASTGLRQL